MTLELHQNERLISSVNLQFYQIGNTKKQDFLMTIAFILFISFILIVYSNRQGYSATVIPGLSHKYKLVKMI